MSLLEIRDLSVFYGDAQALAGVSLDVAAGEIVAIVGANGAGKTSLIRTIAGILAPRAGSVRFDGRDVAGLSSATICNLGVGQVAEGRQVFPTMTVQETTPASVVQSARSASVPGPYTYRMTRRQQKTPALTTATA